MGMPFKRCRVRLDQAYQIRTGLIYELAKAALKIVLSNTRNPLLGGTQHRFDRDQHVELWTLYSPP